MSKNSRKIAFITGSSQRIGKDIAIFLAKNNWDIVIHYNKSGDHAHDVKSIIDGISSSYIIKADLANEKELCNIFPIINDNFGQVNLLINNASSFKKDHLSNLPLSAWHDNFNVNLRAPTMLIDGFLKQPNVSGNIINILDYCALKPHSSYVSYGLSRAALLLLSKTIAPDIAPSVRINMIAPGPALANPDLDMNIFNNSWQESPLKLATNPKEICNTIDFIINTSSLTGQVIALDGGKHLIDNKYV
jgi:NAD(P)-dependent dehydrogenase (short-subunit alcohol dehydrogenase family)